MMDPLTLVSLISTASDVVSGISNLVSGSNSGSSAETSQFANMVQNAGSGSETVLNTAGSANSAISFTGVIQQGAINIQSQGAAILNAANGEVISGQTLDDLNNILSGNAPVADADTLSDAFAETDGNINTNSNEATPANNGGILGNTKLNDPFGIKAAEANGSPIAAPSVVPADSNLANLPIAGLETTEGGEKTNTATNAKINTNVIGQTDNAPVIAVNEKNVNKEKILKLADNVDDNAVQGLQNNTLGKDPNKLAQSNGAVASSIVSNAADRLHDKNTLLNSANTSGIVGQHFEQGRIGDAVRALRSKDELKDTLNTVDTYKVVSVSKKDNIIDVRLDPANLGKVQIKMDFTDGKTNIMVTADRPETLGILQRDTKSIEKILTDNGINVDSSSLSFDLRDQQQQQQSRDGLNFLTGKPLSFRVEEQITNMIAANDDLSRGSYSGYGNIAANGMLNIIV